MKAIFSFVEKRDIISLYRSDILKHGGSAKHKILAVFNSIPNAIARHEWHFSPGAPHASKFYRFDAEHRLQRTNYEAEGAFLTDYHELYDPVKAGIAFPLSCAAASGGMVVTNLGGRASNDLVWPEVKIERGGEQILSFWYQASENGAFDVEVDGRCAGTVPVKGTDGRLAAAERRVTLSPGVHRIRLSNARARMPVIDRMTVEGVRDGRAGR